MGNEIPSNPYKFKPNVKRDLRKGHTPGSDSLPFSDLMLVERTPLPSLDEVGHEFDNTSHHSSNTGSHGGGAASAYVVSGMLFKNKEDLKREFRKRGIDLEKMGGERLVRERSDGEERDRERGIGVEKVKWLDGGSTVISLPGPEAAEILDSVVTVPDSDKTNNEISINTPNNSQITLPTSNPRQDPLSRIAFIASCDTGLSACHLGLAAEIVNPDVEWQLYDAGWCEYGQKRWDAEWVPVWDLGPPEGGWGSRNFGGSGGGPGSGKDSENHETKDYESEMKKKIAA